MAGDSRTYIKVHDGMDEHPKVVGLSDAAFRLLVACWCYCSRQLTDGRIVDAAWKQRGTAKARRELIDAGLVEQCHGFVLMHDYLEHQRSAAEVDELRRRRSEAGKKGGRAKANALASARDVAKQSAKQTPSKPVAETESLTDVRDQTETDPSLRSGGAQQRARRLPDDFKIDDDLRQWARGRGFTDPQVDEMTEQFIRYWRAKSGRDATKRDWPATWQNWVAKEDPRRVRALSVVSNGHTSMTPQQIENILGADSWQLPAPPDDLDPEDDWASYQAWARQLTDEHFAQREAEARAELARRVTT